MCFPQCSVFLFISCFQLDAVLLIILVDMPVCLFFSLALRLIAFLMYRVIFTLFWWYRETLRVEYLTLITLVLKRLTEPPQELPKVGSAICLLYLHYKILGKLIWNIYWICIYSIWDDDQDGAAQKFVEFMNMYSISWEDFSTIVELSKFQVPLHSLIAPWLSEMLLNFHVRIFFLISHVRIMVIWLNSLFPNSLNFWNNW